MRVATFGQKQSLFHFIHKRNQSAITCVICNSLQFDCMKAKRKDQIKIAIVFKNPFDLMEEEEEPMSTPTQPVRYRPEQRQTHHPLPFNPYEIDQEKSQQEAQKARNKIKIQQPSLTSTRNTIKKQPEGNMYNAPFEKTDATDSQQEAKKVVPEKVYVLDENGDPPLLEDLGIEPNRIKERILLVLKAGEPTYEMIADPDLSGPILIAMSLGCLLLLSGKVHFGDIYAMFILGNFLIYFLLNFMSQGQIIPLYNIMSTMGYGLLPMLLLGLIGIFISLKGGLGILVGILIAVWSSIAAGGIIDVQIKDHKNRKPLVVYPLFLFYISFVMIVIF